MKPLNEVSSLELDALTTPASINGGRVFRIAAPAPSTSAVNDPPYFVSAEIAEGAGAALVKLEVALPAGRTFNLLSVQGPSAIEERFQKMKKSGDPFASNSFFQPGSAAILWPMQNRLTGQRLEGDRVRAQVCGQSVELPLNSGRGPHQTPHHLHGLLFDQHAQISRSGHSHLVADFDDDVERGFWTGRSRVRVTQGFSGTHFEMQLQSTNIGSTPVPFGAGAHPYFVAPSGDPEAVRIYIPAKKIVEIDNYENVLPTGRLLPIEPGSHYDFNDQAGRALGGHYFDNLFVDLETDENGFAFADFIDTKAKLRVRLTALFKNVIGVQLYAPKPSDDPSLGVFVALELVTHLPDPREDLWGAQPTHMKLLNPGETASYGYRIDVFNHPHAQ